MTRAVGFCHCHRSLILLCLFLFSMMRTHFRFVLSLAVIAAAPLAATAAAAAGAPARPGHQGVTDMLGSGEHGAPLPNGGAIVNDPTRRQLSCSTPTSRSRR